MIKDNVDFNYAIDKITSKTKPQLYTQETILDSDKMNLTFKEIENALNTLYEKTRYIEDSIAYAKVFLDTKIQDFNEDMNSIIRELETDIDMSKNLSYISYNVPLKENLALLDNRSKDLEKLKPLILKDESLTLDYLNNNDIDFTSIKRISDSVPFEDTLNKTASTKNYKAIYLEEQVHRYGLIETLMISFSQPVTINVFDFKQSNCSITNIRFGLVNGIEERADDYKVLKNNMERTCLYIKFDLVCTNYNEIVYQVDRNKVTENLWNDLREFELSKVNNLSNINKLNAEYIISRSVMDNSTGKFVTERYMSEDKKSINYVKMYSYVFGLDKINFKNVKVEDVGCFISDYINIGELNASTYINLYVDDIKPQNYAIEYSILDGEIERPILPVNYDIIENELICNLDTRFNRDYDVMGKNYMPEIIKKDNQLINLTYEEVKSKTDGNYSITYKSGDSSSGHDCAGLYNNDIRIKCYIRRYGGHTEDIPYINMITIRKYGEDSLWTSKY